MILKMWCSDNNGDDIKYDGNIGVMIIITMMIG